MQTVRHDEGKLIHSLRKHTSAVSVLNLAQDERSVLSGSWDKTVIDWDLNTGEIKRIFEGSGGQISALEMRPMSSLPVPEALGDVVYTSSTLSADNSDKPRANGVLMNGFSAEASATEGGVADDAGSPTDSLFGGNDGDSLFGDNDDVEVEAPSGGNYVDDDEDEFSRVIANGIQEQENEDAEGDVGMADTGEANIAPVTNGTSDTKSDSEAVTSDVPNGTQGTTSISMASNLPHSEEVPLRSSKDAFASTMTDATSIADSTFLAASIDGSLRVWDKRQSTAIAKITPRNVPPWCMNACWSPDGNFIYAGRRNGTVEEFSLHKGLRGAERSFKLPHGSGPVSAVRAMPNGRHLVWFVSIQRTYHALTSSSASYDILRLYDLQQQQTFKHSSVPFLIVPGHRTGVVSQLYIDPTCRYMISTAGTRGWEGSSTEVLLGYEIGVGK